MKLDLISDIHLDCHADNGSSFIKSILNDKQSDILLIAGDITQGGKQEEYTRILSGFREKYIHVIFVTGNHDYYSNGPTNLTGKEWVKYVNHNILEACNKVGNCHFLTKQTNYQVIVEGQRFIGDTMWYRNPDPMFEMYKSWLNDSTEIPDLESWIYDSQASFEDFLEHNLEASDVVMTHHMPSIKCVDIKYVGNPLNCFFVCEMEKLIQRKRPILWVSGHTHYKYEFCIRDTGLVANPFGYPNEHPGIDYKPYCLDI